MALDAAAVARSVTVCSIAHELMERQTSFVMVAPGGVAPRSLVHGAATLSTSSVVGTSDPRKHVDQTQPGCLRATVAPSLRGLLPLAGASTTAAALLRKRRRLRRSATSVRASSSSMPAPAVGEEKKRPLVAVIGAGWGGLGAAKALCENDCEVMLLDGIPDPSGATPMLTPTGKPFEPGTRGFWKDYPNINKMLGDLDIPEEDVFTDFTESAFYSPDGLEATAPVFAGAPELPSPLGQVLASFSRFKRLPVQDRLSISGLLAAMVDFDRDEKTFAAYDRMTAHELFIRCGLSRRLVEDFLKPTLQVGLFKPPEELSAAVTMELLYFYALAHQTSFDVRWLRRGTVSETLVKPLVANLIEEYGLDVRGSTFVESLVLGEDGNITGLRCKKRGSSSSMELQNFDAVVLALGAGGMRAVMAGSPQVALKCPNLSAAGALRGVDVMACRLWLDGYVGTEAPANVLSRFESLRGAGGTFFMLDQLQPDQEALWGDEEPQGSVVACDFYNAGGLFPLPDEEIVRLLLEELLPAAVPAFGSVKVVDSYVKRYGSAVSWFSPGSFQSRPTLETPIPNLVCAGDWVRLGSREHGAKGLCQERAFVTGFEAANSLARRGILGPDRKQEHPVLPVRDDEPQVKAGRMASKMLGKALGPFGLASPWAR